MQTNKPKVSIIIPVYNREDYIGETINSVLNQDYENFEIILVDDASSDNSNAVMQKFADDEDRVILLKNTLNKGRSGSVNVGLEKANGDYITFLDSDDLFSEERLKKQVRFMQENSDVDMSYGNMVEFSEEGDEKNWDSIEPVDFFSLLKERSEMSFEELDVFPYVSAFIHKDAGTSKFKNEFIPKVGINRIIL